MMLRSVLLVCSNSSNAPAFIRLSTHFLFTPSLSAILSQNSVKLLYAPFSFLSSTIFPTGSAPTFFMLPSPKRIFPFSTVNF